MLRRGLHERDCGSDLHFPPCSQFKTVKPVGDRVLVKVDKQELKSIGGVLLPSTAAKKPTAGEIVAMGDVSTVKVRPC
jgi:chaperonin GroES